MYYGICARYYGEGGGGVSTSLFNKIERMLKQMLKSFPRAFILQCEKAKGEQLSVLAITTLNIKGKRYDQVL